MSFKLKHITVHALKNEDRESKLVSVTTLNVAGPIINAPTFEEAAAKFEAALKLSSAVRNLLYFKGASKMATEKSRRDYAMAAKERIENVEYHSIAV